MQGGFFFFSFFIIKCYLYFLITEKPRLDLQANTVENEGLLIVPRRKNSSVMKRFRRPAPALCGWRQMLQDGIGTTS